MRKADYVMLSVSDTGTPMTAEVQARLFEAFILESQGYNVLLPKPYTLAMLTHKMRELLDASK